MSQFAGFGKEFQTPGGKGVGSPQVIEVPVERIVEKISVQLEPKIGAELTTVYSRLEHLAISQQETGESLKAEIGKINEILDKLHASTIGEELTKLKDQIAENSELIKKESFDTFSANLEAIKESIDSIQTETTAYKLERTTELTALVDTIKTLQDAQSHHIINAKGHFENLYRTGTESKKNIKVLGERIDDAVASYQTRFDELEKFFNLTDDKNKKRSEYVQAKLGVMDDRLHQIKIRVENQDSTHLETKQHFLKQVDELRKDQQNYFKISETSQKSAKDQELKHNLLINQKLDSLDHGNAKFAADVTKTFAAVRAQLSLQKNDTQLIMDKISEKDPYKIPMLTMGIINLIGLGVVISYLFML